VHRHSRTIAGGLITQRHEIIVSHGNGPQVDAVSLAFEIASQRTDRLARTDVPQCTAMSLGTSGATSNRQ
jgi:carbamate kinase